MKKRLFTDKKELFIKNKWPYNITRRTKGNYTQTIKNETLFNERGINFLFCINADFQFRGK